VSDFTSTLAAVAAEAIAATDTSFIKRAQKGSERKCPYPPIEFFGGQSKNYFRQPRF
jgi:hypothetical protein